MKHDDHVALIRDGVTEAGGVWADFGSGAGAFTLALRDLAGPDVEIWSIDRDRSVLKAQRAQFDRQFPATDLHTIAADFGEPLELPPLDGIVAANSVHFVRDQISILADWRTYLKPDGRVILVEYDTDSRSHWLPYPFSFRALSAIAKSAGYRVPRLLKTRPSNWNDSIYSALLRPVES